MERKGTEKFEWNISYPFAIGDFNQYAKITCVKATAVLGVLGVELKVL